MDLFLVLSGRQTPFRNSCYWYLYWWVDADNICYEQLLIKNGFINLFSMWVRLLWCGPFHDDNRIKETSINGLHPSFDPSMCCFLWKAKVPFLKLVRNAMSVTNLESGSSSSERPKLITPKGTRTSWPKARWMLSVTIALDSSVMSPSTQLLDVEYWFCQRQLQLCKVPLKIYCQLPLFGFHRTLLSENTLFLRHWTLFLKQKQIPT